MSNLGLPPTVRLTILGEAGSLDLVVPRWTQIARLTEAYTHQHGLTGAWVLRGADGRLVESGDEVARLGLTDGAVMVLTRRYGSVAGPRGRIEQRLREAVRSRLPGLALLVAFVAAGIAVTVSGAQDLRIAVTAVLAVGAALVFLPAEAALTGSTPSRLRRRMLEIRDVAPGFAAAAAVTGLHLGPRVGAVSTVLVASLAALAAAAVGLAMTRDGHDEFLRVWLVTAAGYLVVSLVVALTSASLVSVCAVLLGGSVLMSRLLPTLVVDVPDRVLLDLDRLAVTTWSARQRPRARRRTTVVRSRDIEHLVDRGRQLMLAGTFAVAGTAVASAAYLVHVPGHGAHRIGVLVAAFLAAAGLALVARSVRAAVPRAVMRVAAAVVFLLSATRLALDAGPGSAALVVAGCVVVGVLVVIVAVALGQGWRSIWWARIADTAETSSLVIGVALVPLTCGLFDAARIWTS